MDGPQPPRSPSPSVSPDSSSSSESPGQSRARKRAGGPSPIDVEPKMPRTEVSASEALRIKERTLAAADSTSEPYVSSKRQGILKGAESKSESSAKRAHFSDDIQPSQATQPEFTYKLLSRLLSEEPFKSTGNLSQDQKAELFAAIDETSFIKSGLIDREKFRPVVEELLQKTRFAAENNANKHKAETAPEGHDHRWLSASDLMTIFERKTFPLTIAAEFDLESLELKDELQQCDKFAALLALLAKADENKLPARNAISERIDELFADKIDAELYSTTVDEYEGKVLGPLTYQILQQLWSKYHSNLPLSHAANPTGSFAEFCMKSGSEEEQVAKTNGDGNRAMREQLLHAYQQQIALYPQVSQEQQALTAQHLQVMAQLESMISQYDILQAQAAAKQQLGFLLTKKQHLEKLFAKDQELLMLMSTHQVPLSQKELLKVIYSKLKDKAGLAEATKPSRQFMEAGYGAKLTAELEVLGNRDVGNEATKLCKIWQAFSQEASKLGEYIVPTIDYDPNFTVTQAKLNKLAEQRRSEFQRLDN